MALYSIRRYHDISCGHRVVGHESKCAHLHGHNYRIHFDCVAESLDSIGRVIDFGVVKSRLCNWVEENWDHRFLIWHEDPLLRPLRRYAPSSLVVVAFNPTAEHMAKHLVLHVGPLQLRDTGVLLRSCTIDETRKCSATYTKKGLSDGND